MRSFVAALVVVPVLALCACAGTAVRQDVTVTPWAADIDDVLESGPSELERDVLADHQVDESEYLRAQRAFIECTAASGYVTRFVDGQYETTAAPGTPSDSDVNDVLDDCRTGTIADIEYFYYAMRENPRNISYAQGVRECFRARDIALGSGMSDAELEQLVDAPDFDPATPEVRGCVYDPFNASDMSLEQLEALWPEDATAFDAQRE